MDSRKTFFLLVLVGLGGALVVWDHFQGVPTDDRATKEKRVLTIDAKAVTRLELIQSNQTIVLEKTAANWDLKQPLAVRADFSAVSSILDELEFAERTRVLTEKDLQGVSLAELGLTAPRLTIRLHTKTGTTVLKIGNDTPAKDALYVNVEGQRPVSVVRKSTFDRAQQTLDQLRSRTAFEFEPANTTRIEIKAADRSIELTRSNIWMVARPLTARADQTKISELLADLENLRVVDFLSEKPEDVHTYHLDEPDREVAVHAGTTGSTLVLGKPLTNDSNKVVAKVKGADSIFTIPADAARKFSVQINDLRDSRVLPFLANAVPGIDIVRGSDRISLKTDNHDWRITGPVTLAGDADAIRRFLDELAGVPVKQFTADVATDLDPFGLATPALTISLAGVTDLLVGGVDVTNGVRFVKRADEPFIYGVATNALDFVPATYGEFRSRAIFAVKPEQITKLTVGEVTVGRDEQGQWRLVSPAQGILHTEAVEAVVGLVAGLRAESFGRLKVESDQANPVIKFVAAGVTHWLANAPDGQSAADSVELTFRLAGPVVETLTKKLVTDAKP